MSEALQRYRILEKRLFEIRKKHEGQESEEEDCHLELMDRVWEGLSEEDRKLTESSAVIEGG